MVMVVDSKVGLTLILLVVLELLVTGLLAVVGRLRTVWWGVVAAVILLLVLLHGILVCVVRVVVAVVGHVVGRRDDVHVDVHIDVEVFLLTLLEVSNSRGIVNWILAVL